LQLKKAHIVENEKGKYFLYNPGIGDRYDENNWVNSYFDNAVSPIKERVIIALKELHGR
jgi:hypothetical protein